MNESDLIRRARQSVDMTTEEAAQLVHVTRRTFETWESGKQKIPTAKLELFMNKLEGKRPLNRSLIMVIGGDEFCPVPIDVIAEDTFLSCDETADKTQAIISSLAIDRISGRPCVHRTRFYIAQNKHVIKAVKKWKSVLDK